MESSGNVTQVTSRGSNTSKVQGKLAKESRGTAKHKATSNLPTVAFSDHTCGQATGHKGTITQLEANYELILTLVTTLNKHLKKREVIGPESKNLATKCLDEVTRICEVCIRKEVRRRDSVGPLIVEFSNPKPKGGDTAQGRNPPIIERFHGHSAKSGPPGIGINSGESPNNDAPHGVIRTLRGSALPMQSAILGQLRLVGEGMDHTAGLQQHSPPCNLTGPQRLDTRHPLPENQNPDVFLSSTSLDLLSHRAPQKAIQMTEESTMTPGIKFGRATYTAVPPKIMYSEYTTDMRSWQWKLPLSNYDLYLPSIMTYPDDSYHTDDSPVFRHGSSLPNKEIIVIWRHLSIRHSEELFRWDKIFVESLSTTLNCLKQEFTKQNNVHSGQEPQVNGGIELWKNFHWPRTFFIEHLRHRYTQEYGPPQYLVDEYHIIQFLNTRDTLCSMSTETMLEANQLFGFDGQKAYRASIGFGSSENMIDVRRFIPQIVVCSDIETYIATIGEEFVFDPTLWDPHHRYSEIEATTTYTLHPPVVWLKWDQTRKAFVGVPPLILEQRSTEGKELHLTVVAFSFLGLPEGVQYERTVKASVVVHLRSPCTLTPNDKKSESKGSPEEPTLMDTLEKIEVSIDLMRPPSEFSGPIDQRTGHQVAIDEAPVLEAGGSLSAKVNRVTDTGTIAPPMEADQANTMQKSEEFTLQSGHKYDPQTDEGEDSFPIVGDWDSTWAIEHTALRPSFRAWDRQRSYIEQCVTIRGRKMLGLFKRRKDGESDSSETELSDDEGRFLKDIPFLRGCQKPERPEWKVVSNEDEPPIAIYGPARMIYNDRSRADTPVLGPMKSYVNIIDRSMNGPASDKTKPRGMRHQYQPTQGMLSPPVSTAETLTIKCTIAPTPISVKSSPTTAFAMEVATTNSVEYESLLPAMTRGNSSESESSSAYSRGVWRNERSPLLGEFDHETTDSGEDGMIIGKVLDTLEVNTARGSVPWSPID